MNKEELKAWLESQAKYYDEVSQSKDFASSHNYHEGKFWAYMEVLEKLEKEENDS